MSELVVSCPAPRVAQLELTRGPHNFVDEGSLTALADALLDLDADPDVSVVVICSEGKNFCAGVDLRGMQSAGIRRFYRQALRIFSGRKPVVAAVQGAAVGGGLGLAMAADFRVVAPHSRLTANFAKLGFHQGFGLSVTLPAVLGRQRATELLYSGRDVDGATALELGLADRLSSDAADVRRDAVAFASELAASAPLSLVAIRATLRRELVAQVSVALDLEADAQSALLGTSDFAEGLDAARAKRAPAFTGS
jgi:enoyl-CoA hydratase/carnithine racemase